MTHARSLVARRTPLALHSGPEPIFLREIAVVGPGVVGMPIAALLATAELWAPDGTPTRVTVVQRASASSGWKVGAINAGRSPIGALEPAHRRAGRAGRGERPSARDDGVRRHPRRGRRARLRPDGATRDRRPTTRTCSRRCTASRTALAQRTAGSVPIVVIESTLAPTTLADGGAAAVRAARPRGRTRRAARAQPEPGDARRRGRADSLTTDKLVGTLSPGTGPRVAVAVRAHRDAGHGALHQRADGGGRDDARECLARRPHRLRGGGRALLRRARHRLLRRATAASTRGSRRSAARSCPPCGGLLVPTIGVGGQQSAQGWRVPLVARARGGRESGAQPRPRGAPDQRRVARAGRSPWSSASPARSRTFDRPARRRLPRRLGRRTQLAHASRWRASSWRAARASRCTTRT